MNLNYNRLIVKTALIAACSILVCPQAFGQATQGGASNAVALPTNPLASTNNYISSYGAANPLHPVRSFYPHHQIQNPSNPWLPPNLSQPQTGLNPNGATSALGSLGTPQSVLTNPNTVQNPGFPTTPTYNIGSNTPTTQTVIGGGGGGTSAVLAAPGNPGNQNVGVTSTVNGGASIPSALFP